ncbi:AAA family ATPase [Cystobacter fuscus]|uniref:AAA family ATPase n=1 Tax=Cystobacter fuscus TaxID=43 RepID=UPI002B31C606|nr:AAA family ATPase [Cystobacter fuscus]
MTSQAAIQVELLGRARVISSEHPPRHLERKTAALVTYLALEGATERRRLAGLLWPESSEEKARGNLRQLLHRLKGKLGGHGIEGDDPVWLCDGLSVDAVLLREVILARDYARLSKFHGELLAGFTFDDCTELDEWLSKQRIYFHQLRIRAAEEQALQLEKEGRFDTAMDAARRLLNLDPASEEGWRIVMRLHLHQGDRSAALMAYRACQDLLKELGARPSPPTEELARKIEQQPNPVRAPPRTEMSALPLSILSPPELIGREREWAFMEEAWAANRPVYVCGEAGIGKTRLVSEFCNAQGSWLLVPARPSDPSFPYATCARMIQLLLEVTSAHGLERRVLQDLSRISPMRGLDGRGPPTTPEEKLRLSESFAQLLSLLGHEMEALVLDDAHHCDPASFELYLRAQDLLEQKASPRRPRIITCFRSFELPGTFESLLNRYVETGLARRLVLESLPPGAVGPLLASMAVPGLESLAEEMASYTGGNPLFIVETVKSLVETTHVSKLALIYLPPPLRLVLILEQLFKRLSPDALRLARIIAVAGTAFRSRHASRILDLSLEQLATPWKELERARLLKGTSFTSGLVRGLVIETMPQDVRDGVVHWILRLLRDDR